MTVARQECVGGESSLAAVSAESNFRELDDAFLQTQTRIWLGEVLQIRFNDEANICDILADGDLLFELSQVLPRLSPNLPVDASHSKSNESKSLGSNKSTRRYMPYYNVGSFLKMCKSLGINDVDLFSPSDVVEKRNTRKVCMCIRSLSKKARSRDLNVPDFDIVTRTLSMPTDMVECIRKSLEMSQCNSSLSVRDEMETSSGVRCWKRISGQVSSVSNGNSSDICDDADSSFVVGISNGHANNFDVKSSKVLSSEVFPNYHIETELNAQGLEIYEEEQCEYLSPTIAESVGSPCSQYFSDQDVNMPSSYDGYDSHIGGKVELSSEARSTYVSSSLPHAPIDWGVDHTNFWDHSDDNECTGKTDCVYQSIVTDLAFIDGGSSADNSPSKVEHEKCSWIEQGSCTKSVSFEVADGGAHEYVLEDDFNYSGSLKAYTKDSPMSSDVATHSLVADVSFCDGKDNEPSNELLAQRRLYVPKHNNNLDFSSCNGEIYSSLICREVVNDVVKSLGDDLNSTDAYSEDFPGKSSPVELSPSQIDYLPLGCKMADQFAVKSNGIDNNRIHLGNVDSTSLVHPHLTKNLEKESSEHIKQEGDSKEIPQKPQKKLLKSVVKGTALVGIAVFLLHLRKTKQVSRSKGTIQKVEVLKQSKPGAASKRGQNGGSTSSVYPAEKLNFGM